MVWIVANTGTLVLLTQQMPVFTKHYELMSAQLFRMQKKYIKQMLNQGLLSSVSADLYQVKQKQTVLVFAPDLE